jgi:prepilin-type processing-associated H-X9-DG protein
MVRAGLALPATLDESLADCIRGPHEPLAWYGATGLSWFVGTLTQTQYNHILPPNARTADCALDRTNPLMGFVAARSNHPGRVHALFLDGSCHPIRDTVRREIWVALGTRAGGEVIGQD